MPAVVGPHASVRRLLFVLLNVDRHAISRPQLQAPHYAGECFGSLSSPFDRNLCWLLFSGQAGTELSASTQCEWARRHGIDCAAIRNVRRPIQWSEGRNLALPSSTFVCNVGSMRVSTKNCTASLGDGSGRALARRAVAGPDADEGECACRSGQFCIGVHGMHYCITDAGQDIPAQFDNHLSTQSLPRCRPRQALFVSEIDLARDATVLATAPSRICM
ncbi:hypothetical protein SAMN02927914_06227 [Mesorhizobium qingshengii]|uniref:Uncharacterized protein n=1 Tax=Mesorhizobium qingshengii TaxID=1165689 RepID=A0A1G5ZUP1_9HYPH|nr:hypothetical protein SAMN02927914_06227 [Mesorhizobium qingshengii]